jgi:hypothetical protein
MWEGGQHPAQREGEPESYWLERCGLLDDAERAEILKRARILILYNKGRRPDDPRSNFIKDEQGFIEHCLDHDMLSDSETPDVW